MSDIDPSPYRINGHLDHVPSRGTQGLYLHVRRSESHQSKKTKARLALQEIMSWTEVNLNDEK